jgi:threonine dehydratase
MMPKPFSAMKHRAILGYGTQVHVVENQNCAETKLRELVGDYQAVVVRPLNDPFLIASQGAVMVEIVDHVADLDIVLAPVGGGGLPSGLCLAAHALRPRMAIFALSRPAPWMQWSRSSRTVRSHAQPNTLADNLRTSLGSWPSRFSVGT